MKSPSLAVSAVVCAAVLLGPPLVQGQPLPRDPAERARIIAQILEANARQLTLFDRSGQAVGTVGLRDLYTQPVLSPDAKRVAVIKPDLDKETNDLWVIDVATARATQVTSSKPREGRELAGLVAGRHHRGVRGAARRLLRPVSESAGGRRAGGAAVQELGAADAHRLVAGRPLSRLLLDRPHGWRAVRAADRRHRRTHADRDLPQQVPGAGTTACRRTARFVSFVSNSSGRNEVYVVPFDPAAAPGARVVARADADLGSGRHRHGVLAA